MTRRDSIEVSRDLLEKLAFESGRTIDMGGEVDQLRVGRLWFVAPKPIGEHVPSQRQASA